MAGNFNHTPVLLNECIQMLNIKPNGIYLDCTVGGGGHSRRIAERLTDGRLIGVDRDENALAKAEEILNPYKSKTTLIRTNFFETDYILGQAGIDSLDGVLMDLGVSSHQLDEPTRGFSYADPADAPLDMRMDNRQKLTAADVVNTYGEEELTRILYEYGEERWAVRIAQFIINARTDKPIEGTRELVDVIMRAVPKAARQEGSHPAKRTFQAIRIEVNGELGELEESVRIYANRLNSGGRICVISFHSLEDRLVKTVFRGLENPCVCPRDFPICSCGKTASAVTITKRPITPSDAELMDNPRSKSAKLRVAERIK
jgi:16S rRNA (cytosine1402-N4)-methyltransferase